MTKSEVLETQVKAADRRVTERRLTERIRNKWARIARGRLPSLREVEDLNLGPDRPYCFAIDLRLSDVFPYFVFMGEELTRFSSAYPLGDPRREKTLLDAAMGKMDEAALNRAPVEYSDIVKVGNGGRIAFRSVLLPVSENGQDVTHIFGAAKGRML